MRDCDFTGVTLHPRALMGFRRFNAGKYFEAHEELEAAWRDESGPIRDLYQGILLVGVALYHLERKNYSGALKVVRRGLEKLALFPENVLGINVSQIQSDAQRLEEYIAAGDWEKPAPRVRPVAVIP